MLVIRELQMEAFKEEAHRAFEDEMVAHLKEFWPPMFKMIGAEQMRKAVQLGIRQADHYGFTFRGPVQFYLELMLLLGSSFDTDPQYPWAAEILANPDFDQMRRADQLYDRLQDYREKADGPEDAYLFNALRNIAMLLVQQPLELSSEDFLSAMRQEILRIYPQKVSYVGIEAIETLIYKGIAGAEKQKFSTQRGIALVIMLIFAFGHGCGADPFYPWIAQTLRDDTITDPNIRAEHLQTKALTWLKHVLADADGGS